VGILFELITSLNRLADTTKLEDPGTKDETARLAFEEGSRLLKELGQLLGLFFEEPKAKSLGGDDALVSGMMSLLIDLRNTLLNTAKGISDKNDPTRKTLFEQTDVIRKRLADLGVTLEDRPGGTAWRVE
jgi:cysteinyl-tRNA synthetase